MNREDRNKARLKALVALAAEGLNGAEAAERLKLSAPALNQWMHRHPEAEDVLALLRDNRKRTRTKQGGIAAEIIVFRLRLVQAGRKAGMTDRDIARGMDLTPGGLSHWLKRNAPWGVDDAVNEFSDDDS